MRRTPKRLASFRKAKTHKRSRRRKIPKNLVTGICLTLFSITIGAAWMLTRESATIANVPVPLFVKAFEDGTARNYFLVGNTRAFHDRLERMGIKDAIKAFYRPKIHDEVKLDQYIHQIFYEDTGFVGDAYYVNSQGILTLKNPAASVSQLTAGDFPQWFQLARAAGVVVGSKQENGVQYVISPTGKVAPYSDVAAAFPPEELRNLLEIRRQTIMSPR